MLENDYPQNENLLDVNQNINKQSKLSTENASQTEFKTIKNDNNENNQNEQNLENEKTEKDVKASFGGVVIEEHIEKADTIISNKSKKKKTDENDDEVAYEGDEDFNSDKKNKKTNLKKRNNFMYHININKTFLKYFTIVIIIIYIIVTIISCKIFHDRRDDKPYLFCFELYRSIEDLQDMSQKDIIYFVTDLNSFYILHLIFLFLFISVCYMLIKGRKSDINSFFKDMSIFFVSTLIFNIPIFISGMITDYFYGNHIQPFVYLILTFLGFICMMKIFIVAKRHKYKNITNLINVSILTSFMTAYQCYCFLFCLSYSYMNFYKPKLNGDNSIDKEYPEVEIIWVCFFFAIGIIVLTVFKDIFFVIAMIIIENGFLYAKRISNYLLTTTLVNIGILSLNFASIIVIIFAYNKKVFRLKEIK